MLRDGSIKILQGVRELFEIFDAPTSSPAEEAAAAAAPKGEPMKAPASSKVILIGRRLEDYDFARSVRTALGSNS